ncbi:MAG: alpha/beta hydrolase [Nanoarchaeota archaeon]|nr:alpha/beta hydrolase [Nanoarchaeota archaeon]MBU1051002.1 alpha/beta hydrolase [Nanoarchaeota archaeon]MBU1988983.1 alpha/beta hydrolase [Nanoarchaeota archaeon]
MLEKLVRVVSLSFAGCVVGCGFSSFQDPCAVPNVECDFMTNSYGVETQWSFYSGERGQPLIIAVHGFRGSSFDFQDFFLEKYNLLSYTQPGHVPSDPLPVKHTIPATAKVLEDIINFAHDSPFIYEHSDMENVYLVGNSMGGFTVCQYLNDNPENNLNAIVINSYDSFSSEFIQTLLSVGLTLEGIFNPVRDISSLSEYCETILDFDVSQTLPYTNHNISWIISDRDEFFPIEESRTLDFRYAGDVYEIESKHSLYFETVKTIRDIVNDLITSGGVDY